MGKKLVWFRQDLRVRDNPALHEAANEGEVVAVFIEAQEQRKQHHESAAKVGFIFDTLLELRSELNELGIPLHIKTCATFTDQISALQQCIKEYDADSIYFNREYPVNEMERDKELVERLKKEEIAVHQYDGDLALEPSLVKNKQGEPYKVFTPYKKAWIEIHKHSPIEPLSSPHKQTSNIHNQVTEDFSQEYRHDLWQAGEVAAHERLNQFLDGVDQYKDQRDIPAVAGTSFLSPYLAMGSISAKQCIHALLEHYDGDEQKLYGNTWFSEIVWREFYRQILIDNPQIAKHKAFNTSAKEVWVNNKEAFEAWKEGRTGFPIIDAAMRQLNQTGWMHNRLRMNAAMFLNKLCLVDWRLGEKYFMEKLIDGDFASNNGGWQWCSSTGADGAPYFRIMSPLSQSKRFDPKGDFIRKLVPELEGLDNKSIHEPSVEQRKKVGYPEPVIDYKSARKRALELLS
ncbi:cryptochrome/photolyase family protein [Kangiella geojedonensis]|uniref:Deoxyribodipyrimidine photolyase n=1 Tax=Kangiella geojedonensis TaxID=914150 RepID=A0A0F6RBJ1_9GAMM|nr:FAD-binding domain-containing protein [Kangiella geojedonensis]AKE51191.1 deoxyribodipyrimidine photolyase [Kangiella geojedonensis]